MTIYLDIVLFENIILNYIILLSTAIISKAKISTLRIFSSSLVRRDFFNFKLYSRY